MPITPLSAARIAGEVGLAGGTITGGTCAAHYANKVVKVQQDIKKIKEQTSIVTSENMRLKYEVSEVKGQVMFLSSYWRYIKMKYSDSYKNDMDDVIKKLCTIVGSNVCSRY